MRFERCVLTDEAAYEAWRRREAIATACERTRTFLGSLEYLSISDSRQASELRHRLREEASEHVLRQAVLFLGGIHPAQAGQADLMRDLMRIVGPPERDCPQPTMVRPPPRGRRGLTMEELAELAAMR